MKNDLVYPGIVWVFLCVCAIAWAIKPGDYDIEALEASLQAFCDAIKFPSEVDVRCAIYVPTKGEYLVQATNYMPAGKIGKGGKIHQRQGIVGPSYRSKRKYVEILEHQDFSNSTYFQEYMEEKFGFTPEEAGRISRDRRTYFASPILDEKRCVIGVLYCDTNEVDFYKDPQVAENSQHLVPFFRQLLKLKGG